jgi:hypothetical protein
MNTWQELEQAIDDVKQGSLVYGKIKLLPEILRNELRFD